MKFNSIIKSIIVEQGRYEILKKTYTQPKKKGEKVKPARMSVQDLDKIVLADPIRSGRESAIQELKYLWDGPVQIKTRNLEMNSLNMKIDVAILTQV